MRFIRINSNFTPYYIVNKLENVGEKQTIEKDSGIYYYQMKKCKDHPNLTFISFGFEGTDQWWSSNSDTINKLFDINCTECYIKELKGQYPNISFSLAILCECVVLPDNLEWGDDWGVNAILPKDGVDFPRRNDYFMSTHLDETGKLIEK